jgi:hypothetical protein
LAADTIFIDLVIFSMFFVPTILSLTVTTENSGLNQIERHVQTQGYTYAASRWPCHEPAARRCRIGKRRRDIVQIWYKGNRKFCIFSNKPSRDNRRLKRSHSRKYIADKLWVSEAYCTDPCMSGDNLQLETLHSMYACKTYNLKYNQCQYL